MVALLITHAVNLSLGVGGLKFNQISKLAQYELNQPTNQPTNQQNDHFVFEYTQRLNDKLIQNEIL